MPVVNGLMKKYTDRARFVTINIHASQTRALQKQLGFSASPEFYLVDPAGHVLHYWGGDTVDLSDLENLIKALPSSS
jgi:hypothetical protein